MKNRKIIVTILLISILIITLNLFNQVEATSTKKEMLKEQAEYYAQNIDVNNITKEDVLEVYDELSESYTNEELANMLNEYKEEIKEQGVSEEVIGAGQELLKTTDKDSIREIIEEDIDFDSIKEKLDAGYTPNQVVKEIVQETPTEKKIEIAVKLLLANQIFKVTIITIVILFLYGTILRWIIYRKAGRHGWAAIIPLYRQIVMYQICGLSPWLMLLWLIPIFGWIAMLVIAIMKRFCLANSFGRGALFGFGLLFLQPIFESVLAFCSKIKYEGE
jgi:flagellar basal body-associated protein FliL